jgi:hypothetical protein
MEMTSSDLRLHNYKIETGETQEFSDIPEFIIYCKAECKLCL